MASSVSGQVTRVAACAQAGGEKCEWSAQVRGCPAVCAAIVTQRNPKALALLARGRARRKISDLEAALEGAEFFTDDHAALLAVMLGRIDQLSAGIARLTEVIERLLIPCEEQLQQAESMPGWGRRSAQDALAEPART
jgi:transposase